MPKRAVASAGDVPGERRPTAASPSDALQLIAFGLGEEWYALEVSHVRGIEPQTEITPVPKAPDWLVGVFNLHGAIVPAIDLAPIFGLESSERPDSWLLVVFHWDGNQAALLVDSVDEMYEVPRASLEPQIGGMNGTRADLLMGQVRVRDRLIGVLNMRALLASLMEG